MIKPAYCLLFVLLAGCCGSKVSNTKPQQKQLYQYGVIDGLLAGAFDGNLTIGELKKHGDFGIGTFNRADGELIAYNNDVYRVRYNGDVIKVPDTDSTPFAVTTSFIADTSFEINAAVSYDSLQAYIKKACNANSMYAIKITGSFDSITARAIAPGVKPYPTLKQLVESSQRLFYFNKIQATCIGFITPDYLSRVNIPGSHLHFLSEDFKHGGHVFAFKINHVTVHIMELTTMIVESNMNESFMQLIKRKDRSEELKKIE